LKVHSKLNCVTGSTNTLCVNQLQFSRSEIKVQGQMLSKCNHF